MKTALVFSVRPFCRNRVENSRRRRAFSFAAVAFFICLNIFSTTLYAPNKNHVFAASPLENSTTVETELGPIVAQVSTSPELPLDLSPIVLTVELEKPRTFQLAPNDVEGEHGDFDVASFNANAEKRTTNDETARDVVVRRWTLYPNRRGKLVLPPIPLKFSNAENVVFLTLPERVFEIPKSDVATVPLESLAPNLEKLSRFPTLIVVVSALAIVAAIVVFALVRRRLRGAAVEPPKPLETETPSARALRRLAELKESRVYLENALEFYPAVAAILRRYLAEEFGLNAEEKTTEEVSRLLESGNAQSAVVKRFNNDVEKQNIVADILRTPEIRRDVERVLSAVDLVKFARRSPTFDDARQIFDATSRAVDAASRRFETALDELARRRAAEQNDAETPK